MVSSDHPSTDVLTVVAVSNRVLIFDSISNLHFFSSYIDLSYPPILFLLLLLLLLLVLLLLPSIFLSFFLSIGVDYVHIYKRCMKRCMFY